jgi:hypothetical protein
MARANLYFKVLIIVMTIFLLFSGLQFSTLNSRSVHLDTFGAGTKEVTVTFESGGINSNSVDIVVPVNATIESATLKITAKKHNNKYPSNITVNIGNDEDIDWAFKGTGYGPMGKQVYFSNGQPNKFLKFINTSFRNDPRVFIPKNATINNVKMVLEGGTGNYNEEYFVTIDYYGYRLCYIKSNGDGTFGTVQTIDTNVGRYAWESVGMGDFDNDGDLDVILGEGQTGNMYLYKKTGSGNSFSARSVVGSISSSWYMYGFATGDFTNDGNIDFICSSNSATLYLFAGDGRGKFTQSTIGATGGPTYPYCKDAEDINNDGNLDLVVGGYRSTTPRNVIYYFEGNGDGTFKNAVLHTAFTASSWYYAYSIMAGDFDNDGNVDILAAYWDGVLQLLKGNGAGVFGAPVSSGIDAGSGSGGDAWDYNKDGKMDVIAIDSQYENPPSWPGSEAKFYEGNGDGTFNAASPLGMVGSYCRGGSAPPPMIIGADNATLDIGDVGTGYDWEYNGIFEDDVVTLNNNNIKQKMNGLLSSNAYTTFTDFYGTEFVSLPLNFTSDNDGLIRITQLEIEYTYTATMHIKGSDTIVTELNDHIVYTSTDTVSLSFIITSSNAGILEFTDLDLYYNIPPDLDMNIPTLIAYEDTENLNLLDLSTFFTDTDEPTVNLNYTVIYNKEADNVEVFTNNSNILKIRPITPNWYGETEIVIQVVDSGKKKTYSNQFKILIQPVNDEPTAKHALPDINLIEGGKGYSIDLSLRDYFTDIENDNLYYTIEVDPKNKLPQYQKEINAIILDNYNVNIESIGDFNTYDNATDYPIPVWVYCDDDIAVNTLRDGDGNYTRQEILIRVKPVNDAPEWLSIPTTYLLEDDIRNFRNCVNLYDYLYDDESELDDLIIQIIGNSNPKIDVNIKKNYLSVTTDPDYYGSTVVTLRASEPNPEFKNEIGFEIIIQPINDRPWITYDPPPYNYDSVNDTVILIGDAFDVEDTVQLVEVKIESMDTNSADSINFDWQQAEIWFEELSDIRSMWLYTWDTITVPDGDYEITARVYDGELMNETGVILNVKNGKNLEPIVDITTPEEDAIVSGDVLIRGTVTDPDNNGIEQLQIRIGRDMDWTQIALTSKNGTVDWFYSWDSTKVDDDSYVISAKAYDGRSWSAPVNRRVDVLNGKNATGPSTSSKRDESKEINWVAVSIIATIVVLLVIGLLVMFLIIRRGRKKILEYVPEGRIEPLEDVEARLRPQLGPGVSIEHMPLPPAPSGVGTAAMPALPSAPATITPTHPTLPAAAPVTAAPAAIPSLPALPPATSGGGYGLYAQQSTTPTPAAAPMPVTPAGGYKPPATSEPIATAKPATESKPEEKTE